MLSVLTQTNLCQGGGGQCDCEHFRPKADDPAHCWECSHGFTINAPAVTQLQPTVCGSSNVAKIFEGLTSRHLTGTSQLNPHQEALATKSSKLKLLSTLQMTASNKCKPSQQQTSGQTFHTLTSQIEIQANGQLMKDPILLQTTVEKRLFIQNLENHGCYLQQMIEVNSSWSHEDVTAQLHLWFPNVFQYFDSHHEKANMTSQTQPDWQLQTLYGCLTECNLWFVTRNPVPNLIFDKWKVGSDIVGTDEEAMSESDNEVVELSSSIANLEITTVTGTSKRSCSINILSSPEAMDSNRQSFRKKCKGLNANTQPAWPHQPGGPISGPVEVKDFLSDSDDNAPSPPNPWFMQFEQTTMVKDGDISNIDL
ncbi:hypothetical protein F5J12DRAFT_897378 [Pisolithus orientalis]|uniref:uncharacterized protein n=1 Tax=Pisolithus orientalis TaxID=936130 RepID=UPI0022247A7A|nr:uncharacterized protein F5J12DRAFT_897378 [Pisolithus orientalis]KAI5992007.1 hypothetical protein F5J12DRAFT_897378 [Pisolithus orientalis]